MFGFKRKTAVPAHQPSLEEIERSLPTKPGMGRSVPPIDNSYRQKPITVPTSEVPARARIAAVGKFDKHELDALPRGIIIKHIFPRKSANNWLVRWHRRKTEYYGVTLDEALTAFFKGNPDMSKLYQSGAYKAAHKVTRVRRSK